MAQFYGNVFLMENEVNVLHTPLTTRILKKNFLSCPRSYEGNLQCKIGLFKIHFASVPTEPR